MAVLFRKGTEGPTGREDETKNIGDLDINRAQVEGFLSQGFSVKDAGKSNIFTAGQTGAPKPTLPDQPSLGDAAGGASQSGLSSSFPAIDRADIEKQATERFAPQKQALGSKFETRIQDIKGLGEQEQRALGAQLGTGRRFSSSAQAFVKHVDGENKKKIAALETQKAEAMANFDFQTAQFVEDSIARERSNQQQEFQNMLQIIETQRKSATAPAKATESQKQQQAAFRQGAILESFRGLTDLDLSAQDLTSQIFSQVNFGDDGESTGLNASIDDISDIVDKFKADKSEIDKLLPDLAKNGAPSDIIKAVQGANSLADALSAAGGFLQEATGLPGEWLFHKQQALANGQEPVSWDDFQARSEQKKREAEARKASLQDTGVSRTEMFNFERALSKDFRSATSESMDARRQLNQMESGLELAKQSFGPDEDLGKIDSISEDGRIIGSLNAPAQAILVTFQKILDPTSVVRESEYARSGSGLSLISNIKGKIGKQITGGAGVTVTDLEDFVILAREFYSEYEANTLDSAKLITNQAESIGANLENILPTSALDIMGSNISDEIIQDEQNAENLVGEAIATDSDLAGTVFTMVEDGLSYADIIELTGIQSAGGSSLANR